MDTFFILAVAWDPVHEHIPNITWNMDLAETQNQPTNIFNVDTAFAVVVWGLRPQKGPFGDIFGMLQIHSTHVDWMRKPPWHVSDC